MASEKAAVANGLVWGAVYAVIGQKDQVLGFQVAIIGASATMLVVDKLAKVL